MKLSCFLLLCFCSAVYAESYPPIDDNAMYPAGEVSAVKPSSNPALYEMMRRLEQLQAEVQQLTGQVEEQANLIAEMKKSQTTMYSDFDGRMQGLEKKPESVTPPAAENEGLIEPEAKSVEPPLAAVPEVKAPPVQKQEAAPASGDEKQQYQQAYEALRNGHTAQAIAQFSALLAKNPNGEYANNAQYWLGEAYRVNQDIDSARLAFNNVIEHYPDSSKVPDALLKLGIIEAEQKNAVKARQYFTRVTLDYSGTTAARLAAKKLLLLDDIK